MSSVSIPRDERGIKLSMIRKCEWRVALKSKANRALRSVSMALNMVASALCTSENLLRSTGRAFMGSSFRVGARPKCTSKFPEAPGLTRSGEEAD